MALALVLVQVVLVLAMGAFLAREALKSRSATNRAPGSHPAEPSGAPLEIPDATPDTAAVKETARDRGCYVRVLDYEADIAAIQRRFTDLESTSEARHAQLTGMFGSLRKASRAEEKESLAQLASTALAARNAPPPDESVAPGVRRVRIIRRQA